MGGGGAGAGAVSHSAYMENVHKDFLNHTASGSGDTTIRSIISVMNTALTAGSSPFLGTVTYNPDTDIAANIAAIDYVRTLADALTYTTDYVTALTAASAAINNDTVDVDITDLDFTALDVAILNSPTINIASLDEAILDTFNIDTTRVTADVLAFSNELEDQLNNITLPRFKAGMLSINAVMSSAFVLGESQLRAFKARDVARYDGEIRSKLQLQASEISGKFLSERREIDARFKLQFQEITSKFKMLHTEKITEYQTQFNEHTARFKTQYAELTARYKLAFQDVTAKFKLQTAEINVRHKLEQRLHIRSATALMLQELMKRTEIEIDIARYTIEVNRLKVIAKSEQAQENLLILEHDRKWDLEVFQYGTAVLGGIGGGQFIPGKKSRAVSALGGALGGAAAGASIGSAFPGYGTAIGAAAGAILGAVGGALS